MPLKKESGRSAVNSNIKILVDEWEKDGSIGISHPLTKKKVIKQAVAIALAKAGKSLGRMGTDGKKVKSRYKGERGVGSRF